MIRTLTACSHEFHISCIDNWLLNRSVICPTCRHDIRDPALATTSATAATAATAATGTTGTTVPAVTAVTATTPIQRHIPRTALRQRDNNTRFVSDITNDISNDIINLLFPPNLQQLNGT